MVFNVTGYADAKIVTEDVLKMIRLEARVAEPGKPQPIIEISLRGQLGFPNSLLEMQKIRDETKAITDALHVRIKNHTVPADYLETPEETDDAGRERLERRVIDDLVMRDNRYKTRIDDISDAVIGAKRMALGDDEPAEDRGVYWFEVNSESYSFEFRVTNLLFDSKLGTSSSKLTTYVRSLRKSPRYRTVAAIPAAARDAAE